MLQYHAEDGIVVLHSRSQGCYYFLFFQKVNGKHKILLLGKPSLFTVGQILQAYTQPSGIKSLLLPIEILAPFGKSPRLVFLSFLSSIKGGEVARFHYSAIKKNKANKRCFQKEIFSLSREKHSLRHYTAFAIWPATFHLNSHNTNMRVKTGVSRRRKRKGEAEIEYPDHIAYTK